MVNFNPNTMWTGDNLPIMRGMNSDCIDLIYLDPPFNSNANYAAPIGSVADGAGFKDVWALTDIDREWLAMLAEDYRALYSILMAIERKSDKSYLIYMARRLIEMKRILKPTGSIYLHCDPTMSHYLKIVMDIIFGRANFINEIIWSYRRWTASKNRLPALHDVILLYGGGGKITFNPVLVENTNPNPSQYVSAKDESGKTVVKRDKKGKPIKRKTSSHLTVGDVWEIPIIGPNSKERVGYPTQKPLALLKRVIETSSKQGDFVLDPFCGCATACVAARVLDRNYVGIDISSKAVDLVKMRMTEKEKGAGQGLFYDGEERTDIPQRTDLGKLPNIRVHLDLLYGRQNGNCRACNTHFDNKRHFHIDHKIPKSRGGSDHIDNLQLLCGSCNSIKGDRPMEYLNARLKEMFGK